MVYPAQQDPCKGVILYPSRHSGKREYIIVCESEGLRAADWTETMVTD